MSLFQYYLDLNDTYAHLPEEEEEEEKDVQYLSMSDSDYTPMSSRPEEDVVFFKDDASKPDYVNKNFKGATEDDNEMEPMLSAGNGVPPGKTTGDHSIGRKGAIHKSGKTGGLLLAEADVHKADDSDSGHSSNYAPGTSPVDGSGYMIPINERTSSEIDRKNPGKSKESSVCSNASSGFHTDYRLELHQPPTYGAVVNRTGSSYV